jgi:predicted nucleic acid-binding protein
MPVTQGTLCDTGPLVALINRDDPDHAICQAALPRLPDPLVTTWPCLTEAMHFAYREGGFAMQDLLWDLVENGRIQIHDLSPAERQRMRELMAQYRDAPMDLADASIVATAEASEMRRVFTIDSHFRAFRPAGRGTFEVTP